MLPPVEPRIDATRLPLIVVTIDGPPTNGEHASYLEQLAELAAVTAPHACVIHARDGGALSREQSRAQARWLSRHKEMLSQNCVGNAFVFGSAVQRFMLSGILLVSSLPFPHRVFAEYDDAERWAWSRLGRG